MITLNEEANLPGALECVKDIAENIFIVDSFSADRTVDIALRYGASIVQRRFRNFGDQWNWALTNCEIRTPWTFMLAPDERLSAALVNEMRQILAQATPYDGFTVQWRLWFLGKPVHITSPVLRLWRTGKCQVSDVAVNEHPVVNGRVGRLSGILEHHDSPSLHHWFEKQNHYSTAEAIAAFRNDALAAQPRLLGTTLERRMWFKNALRRTPLNNVILFLYYWIWKGAWRAGRAGYIAARLWSDVWRFREYKRYEMEVTGRIPRQRVYYASGIPDSRVPQFD